jgi:2-hydroxycyclohexanecarboxyl-CoA dehydrogenase
MTTGPALVTGGTAGIGFACAEALLGAGVGQIGLNGRDRARAEEAAQALRMRFPAAEIESFAGDMGHATVASQVVEGVVTRFGGLSLLVNSTGGTDVPQLLETLTPSAIEGILSRCLLPQLVSSRVALPHLMKTRGCVINIASDAAKIPTVGEAVIGAAMAGIVMFTRTLAMEGKRHGVRANVVTPSVTTGTRHYETVMADAFASKVFAKAEQRAKLGLVSKEELAALVVFLASPAAAKITGQAISMTGGISAL